MKPIVSGQILSVEDWNTTAMYARKYGLNQSSQIRIVPHYILTTVEEIPAYSMIKPDTGAVLDSPPRLIAGGEGFNYFTNGSLAIPANGSGMVKPIEEPCQIRTYTEGSSTSEAGTFPIGKECGYYDGAIHEDYSGFVTLSEENEGLIWISKASDAPRIAKVTETIKPFKRGLARLQYRTSGGDVLASEDEVTAYNACMFTVRAGDYVKILSCWETGLTILSTCEGDRFGDPDGIGLTLDDSCIIGFNVVSGIEQDGDDMIVTNTAITFDRIQRCFRSMDSTEVFDTCCDTTSTSSESSSSSGSPSSSGSSSGSSESESEESSSSEDVPCCDCSLPANEFEDDGGNQGFDFTSYPERLCNGDTVTLELSDPGLPGNPDVYISVDLKDPIFRVGCDATFVSASHGGSDESGESGVLFVNFGPSAVRTVSLTFTIECQEGTCVHGDIFGGIIVGDGRQRIVYGLNPCPEE